MIYFSCDLHRAREHLSIKLIVIVHLARSDRLSAQSTWELVTRVLVWKTHGQFGTNGKLQVTTYRIRGIKCLARVCDGGNFVW